jgi:hypothetical protein
MDISTMLLGLLADPVTYIAGVAIVLLIGSAVQEWRDLRRKRSRDLSDLISEQRIFCRQNRCLHRQGKRRVDLSLPSHAVSFSVGRRSSREAA